MSFFRKYGSVWFLAPNGQTVLLNDLTRFARISSLFRTDPRLGLKYTIADGERPETLSHRLYDTVDYWWVVLLVNNIYDMERQWPMDNERLEAYIQDKYPLHDPDETLHYVDLAGNVTSPQAIMMAEGLANEAQAVSAKALKPVTIREYETELNNARRQIVMVDPDRLNLLVKEIEDAFQ